MFINFYPQQDTRTRSDLPKLDLNVLPVYRAGITGKNIRISILDDGLEHTHYDLSDNYVRIEYIRVKNVILTGSQPMYHIFQ